GRIGELAVEVLVHLLAPVVGSFAFGHVRVEIGAPSLRPVELPIELVAAGREGPGAGVVRTIEDLGRRREPRTRERSQDAVVRGREEDSADVEEDGLRPRREWSRHGVTLSASEATPGHIGIIPRWNSDAFMPCRRMRLRRSMR